MERNKESLTWDVLEQLGTEELRQRLLEETGKNTCDIDGDLTRLLLTELQSRGKDPTLEDDESVKQACDHYREAVTEMSRKNRWYRSWLVTAASVALVLGILLFTLPETAKAGNVGEVLTRWTDSIFQFFVPGEQAYSPEDYVFRTDHPGLQQIYDAATELGITEPVVPMWIPEGFELEELDAFRFVKDTSLHAALTNDDERIILSIICRNNEVLFNHEKDTQGIVVIEVAGVDHYMIHNEESCAITWITENTECSITTDCREEEIHKILNSIYTPEE